ncbi:atherin-like [Corapipo altera]|uniref:atherin-like n=1 Tax=Corapipo altera TaxID=415028 RepID=UPI000FD687AE|nr:atherin-like [Corapipo altera]
MVDRAEGPAPAQREGNNPLKGVTGGFPIPVSAKALSSYRTEKPFSPPTRLAQPVPELGRYRDRPSPPRCRDRARQPRTAFVRGPAAALPRPAAGGSPRHRPAVRGAGTGQCRCPRGCPGRGRREVPPQPLRPAGAIFKCLCQAAAPGEQVPESLRLRCPLPAQARQDALSPHRPPGQMGIGTEFIHPLLQAF